METKGKKFYITIGAFVLAIIVVLAVASSIASSKSSVGSARKLISQQIASQKTITSNHPQFNNFNSLKTYGLTDNQLTGLEYAFSGFVKTNKPSTNTVQLNSTSVALVPNTDYTDNPTTSLTFVVAIGKNSYNAKIIYSGTADINLLLDNVSGKQVYSSGLININTQSPQ